MSFKIEPSVLVAMPFNPSFDNLYDETIIAACAQAGCRSQRVDKKFVAGPIVSQIFMDIDDADLVLADVTEANVNVYHEIGYSLAKSKPLVLIARKSEKEKKLPFDIASYQVLFYEPDEQHLKEFAVRLEDELVAAFRESVAAPCAMRILFGDDTFERHHVDVVMPVFRPLELDDFRDAETLVKKERLDKYEQVESYRVPMYSPMFVLEDHAAFEVIRELLATQGWRSPRLLRDDKRESEPDSKHTLVCLGGPRSNFRTRGLLEWDACRRLVRVESTQAKLSGWHLDVYRPRGTGEDARPEEWMKLAVDEHRALGIVLRVPSAAGTQANLCVFGDRAESTQGAARWLESNLRELAGDVVEAGPGEPLVALVAVRGDWFKDVQLIYAGTPLRTIHCDERGLEAYRAARANLELRH